MNSFKYLADLCLLGIREYKCSIALEKGDVLFEEGTNLVGIYCIKEGVCKITKLSTNGRNHIMRFAKKGDVLGYASVIGQVPVNTTATVLKDLKVCFIPKEIVIDSFGKNSAFSKDVVREFCNDLYNADNFVVDMIQKNVKERLAEAIIRLRDTFGTKADGYIDVYLSREDLASLVGTATESLIRMLSSFSKENLIETKSKYIKIIDENALRKISNN